MIAAIATADLCGAAIATIVAVNLARIQGEHGSLGDDVARHIAFLVIAALVSLITVAVTIYEDGVRSAILRLFGAVKNLAVSRRLGSRIWPEIAEESEAALETGP